MVSHINKIQIPEIATIAKGAGISFFGIISWGALNYSFNVYLARVLKPENFGLYTIGLAIFNVVGMLSLFGLNSGLIRYVALYNGVNDKKRTKGTILFSLKISILISTSIAAILFFLSKDISLKLFHKPSLELVIKYFSLCVPLFVISSVFLYSIQGFKVMKYMVYSRDLFEPINRFLWVTIFFLVGLRLLGVMFAFLIALGLNVLFSYVLLKRIFPISRSPIVPIYESKELLSFSLPLFFIGLMQIGINRVDALLLGHFEEAQQVGIYTAAFQTCVLSAIILRSFNTIFAPIISDLFNRKKHERLELLYKAVTKWIFTLSLPIFLLILLFTKEILSIFGEKFTLGALCLIILSSGQLINSMTGSVGYMLIMIGRSGIAFFNALGVLSLQIVLSLILIPKYGIVGAAIATATSWILLNLIRLLEVFIILKIHPFKISFLKPILAGSVSVAVLYWLEKSVITFEHPLLLLVSGSSIFIGIYAMIILLLGLEDEDKVVFDKVKAKLKM
ncbi:MAG: flippase [Candidatus Heimdallarchaeota archaeon]|nr:MAG: flippase [Candidatus Heimdallarchaeota archaeon]